MSNFKYWSMSKKLAALQTILLVLTILYTLLVRFVPFSSGLFAIIGFFTYVVSGLPFVASIGQIFYGLPRNEDNRLGLISGILVVAKSVFGFGLIPFALPFVIIIWLPILLSLSSIVMNIIILAKKPGPGPDYEGNAIRNNW